MKNKIFFLILFFITVNYGLEAKDNLAYNNSLKFIQESEYIHNKYNSTLIMTPDSICAFASSDILSFSPHIFIDDIIKYEFNNCSVNDSNNSIRTYLNLIPKIHVVENEYFSMSPQNNCGNVIVFFSQIVGNKLMAIVKIYDDKYPPNYSYFSGYGSGDKIYLMIYLDELSNIVNVFYKYTSG